jgi:hypothetical protein
LISGFLGDRGTAIKVANIKFERGIHRKKLKDWVAIEVRYKCAAKMVCERELGRKELSCSLVHRWTVWPRLKVTLFRRKRPVAFT